MKVKTKPIRVLNTGPNGKLAAIEPKDLPYDRTEAEHILDLVVEYYRLQELPVPDKDLADCNELLENEKKAGGLPEHWRNLPEVTPPKPAYGTPEFWKQHWAKKKAAAAGAEELGAPAEKVKKVRLKKIKEKEKTI